MSEHSEADRVAAALAAPFDAGEVKFKPQAVSGSRALAVPFIDARVIQDRLDEVLGVMGWQDSYECMPEGAVVCRLSVRLETEWITKMDVGSPSEQPDEGDRRKAAFSDALKRAAVKFGIGRYLYRSKPQWCDYDPAKRQFTQTPRLLGAPAGKHHDARPANAAPPAAPAASLPPTKVADEKPAAPKTGEELQRRLSDYEQRLVASHGCKPGDLLRFVIDAGKRAGHPQTMTSWNAAGIALAVQEAKRFEAQLKPAQPAGPNQAQCAELSSLARTRGVILRDYLEAHHGGKPVEKLTPDEYAAVSAAIARKPLSQTAAVLSGSNR